MAFLTTGDLHSWANQKEAADLLPAWIERTVKAGLESYDEMRFLKGAFNNLPGIDGRVRGAKVREEFRQFIPEGDSIWEFSVKATSKSKVKGDAKKRIESEPGWTPETTTIVFVTPRGISKVTDLKKELERKAKWKEVRIIDGQSLFDWLNLCPIEALSWAAAIHGVDTGGLKTLDTTWTELVGLTAPKLTKEIIIAKREEASAALAKLLQGEPRHIFVRGDSEFEAKAFVLATLQRDDCRAAKARTLVGLNYATALAASRLAPSVFVVGAEGRSTTTALDEKHRHHVVVTYGDPLPTPPGAIELDRPQRWDFAKALEEAARLSEDEAERLARECGSSVTVMCRRKPSGLAADPWWADGPAGGFLRPLILLGRWDASNSQDRLLIEEITQRSWDDLQRELLAYVDRDDSPFLREGQIWALRSHVDSFVVLAARLGDVELKHFFNVVKTTFSPQTPLITNEESDDLFEAPTGPSEWIRDGIAQALLLFAVRGPFLRPNLSCPILVRGTQDQWGHGPPEAFVQALVAELVALGPHRQLYKSIQEQYAVLIEACPDPLLSALELWLEGNPDEARLILGAKRGLLRDWPDVTELLWGLEVIGWSPEHLARVASIFARLAELHDDSEQRAESNRPLEALSRILMWWSPQTFASLAERLSVIDDVARAYPEIGWKLLWEMRPSGSMIQWPTVKPQMRDFAPSRVELLTNRVVHDGLVGVIERILTAAGTNISRWVDVVGSMSTFPPLQREETRARLDEIIENGLSDEERMFLWEALRDEIARHRTYARTDWALDSNELSKFEELLSRLAPTDEVAKVKWLFDDWLPDLEEELDDASKVQDRIDRRRKAAVRSILDLAGSEGIVRLAEITKFPAFVGSAAGSVIGDLETVKEIAKSALVNTKLDVRFIQSLLWAAAAGSGVASGLQSALYLTELVSWAKRAQVTPARIASMLTWLPAEEDSWKFISDLGPEIETNFWMEVPPPYDLTDERLSKILLEKMIDAGRAGELADMVAFGKITLEANDAIALLDAVIDQIASSASTSARAPRSLREFLRYLSERRDIRDEDLARREILLVPALGYHHGLDLRLFRLLGKDPVFFVSLICQVYRPASQKGQHDAVDDKAKQLASHAYRLLNSWRHHLNPQARRSGDRDTAEYIRPFPGERADGSVDEAELMDWVTKARNAAVNEDRANVTDNEIGQLLAHSPSDLEDQTWPAKAVRIVIEVHHSKQLESGIVNEQFNRRGLHGVVEGGKEEQQFSDQAKVWAKSVGMRWPKTQKVLVALSKMWEADRDRAIEWEKVRRLRQQL